MKTTLFLLSFLASLILSEVVVTEVNNDYNAHGTAVIAAKTFIKGGDKNIFVLPANLTSKQGELLSFAYKVAKEDGNKYPEYYQGLIYQESKAGGIKGYEVAGQEFGLKPMERYYGVPQVKLAAAKDVLKKYPALGSFRTDEEIIAKLITDDHWATRVGSKYYLMRMEGTTPENGLVRYNKGDEGAKGVNAADNAYAQNVVHHVKTVVRSVNHSANIDSPLKNVKVAGL